MVQQGEVVEAEHLDQRRGDAICLFEAEPLVEGGLGTAGGGVDAVDAMRRQGHVVALGDERDLVAQVGQAVVHGRGREHQDPGLDTFLDDSTHQAVVPGFLTLARRLLVAEVVRFVDDHQVVVAPVHVRQVDVAGGAAIA